MKYPQTYIRIGPKTTMNGKKMSGKQAYNEIARIIPDSKLFRNNTRLEGRKIFITGVTGRARTTGRDDVAKEIIKEIRKSDVVPGRVYSRSVGHSYLIDYEDERIVLDLDLKGGYFY